MHAELLDSMARAAYYKYVSIRCRQVFPSTFKGNWTQVSDIVYGWAFQAPYLGMVPANTWQAGTWGKFCQSAFVPVNVQ